MAGCEVGGNIECPVQPDRCPTIGKLECGGESSTLIPDQDPVSLVSDRLLELVNPERSLLHCRVDLCLEAGASEQPNRQGRRQPYRSHDAFSTLILPSRVELLVHGA